MRVLLFGALGDLAGWRERPIDPAPPHLSALLETLTKTDCTLGEALRRAGVRVAVDKVLVRGDADLSQASEVAFLPPMSGG